MGALLSTTSKMGLYLDEYGYQTDPPDKTLGVSPAQQDRYLQQGAYLAWRDPRVKLFSQYIWIDEPLPGKGDYSGFQSGLRYANGTREAVAGPFRDADLLRRQAQAAVGAGASRRQAHGHRPAPRPGLLDLEFAHRGHHRRARLLGDERSSR